ncbi:DUF1365 domain-containing protein [Paractinoplanes ferrugineus]|uniref:DUF1365 domain-containing protein n=1 Tax=Paractinoplanes ferrugineus TaxID=113564 RepID=A0A919J4N8_9ACTN|nr:DUF1365 domain-containing protein [Actinoplanes ferrugineus]
MYDCAVRHVRVTPVERAVSYRTYQWFVDVDELPRDRWLASFRAADHFGDPAASIRQNVEAYLAGHGIDLAGGAIRLLTNARVLGHVFNPLSVYWCHHADGRLVAVIAEVHHTYGARHCYLLHTDTRGPAETPMGFYVSPFDEVAGDYRTSPPEPGGRLALTVALDLDGGRRFVASLRGRRRPADPGSLMRIAARHPLVTAAVSPRIRRRGIRLAAIGG